MSLSTNHSLPVVLVELGLEHKISWQEAERLLDIWEGGSAGSKFPPALWDLLPRHWFYPPPNWSIGPRDMAFAQRLYEFAVGHRIPNRHMDRIWGNANAEEAFMLDLSVENPGDHSGLHMLTVTRLREDLKTLRMLPDTRWKGERVDAVIAELDIRRHQ